MEQILHRLAELDQVSRQLEIPASERTALLKKVGDYTSQFIAGLKQIKAFEEVNHPSKLLAIEENKKTIDQVLELYQSEVATKGVVAASGGQMGYIPGGGIYMAAIADFIAAATNPYAGIYYASPGAATIENEVLDWLKNIFSFPKTAVGNLTSGGSIATFIALTTARDNYQIKNEKITRSVVYVSEQVHHSTQKTLRLIGLEDVIVRYVSLDDNHRIIAAALDELIVKDKRKGLNPFLVVATAGTTDTGAIGPLNMIAEITARHKLWFHVDAAYGGFFILTSKRAMFKGIEKADSLVVDPHKGMFLPYGLGAVLIKDKQAALHSYRYSANYMQDALDDDLADSPANISPELSKHFRGLRLWLPLQIHGIEPFVACLEEKLLLTKYFRQKLLGMGFCLGPEPDLSISYFWYPFDGDANTKNKQLMEAIHRDGSVFLSSSTINKRFVIRMAILSFRTKRATIDKALEMIARCLKAVI